MVRFGSIPIPTTRLPPLASYVSTSTGRAKLWSKSAKDHSPVTTGARILCCEVSAGSRGV
jgi:hypothetical protein